VRLVAVSIKARNDAKLIGKRVLTVGIHVSSAVGSGQHQGQNGTKLIGKRLLYAQGEVTTLTPAPTFGW
jgi:hypothetical protein